jgi:23S rRNA (pseudouridine1915-N3)-methyltransferase
MIHLTFITIGDLPRGAFSEIGAEYKKRLSQYVKLDHKVLKSSETIEKSIPAESYTVILDAAGKSVGSKFFSQRVGTIEDQGQHVTVILGGPKGLSDEIKSRADLLLSLSPMTTTHDLAHLFFLEQLYRAFTILRGKEYHY